MAHAGGYAWLLAWDTSVCKVADGIVCTIYMYIVYICTYMYVHVFAGSC